MDTTKQNEPTTGDAPLQDKELENVCGGADAWRGADSDDQSPEPQNPGDTITVIEVS